MKNRRFSQVSESDESEEFPHLTQSTSGKTVNNNVSDSDFSSSESEERGPPATPIQRRETSASPKKKVASNPLERFILDNPDLSRIDLDDVISEDDDVYILDVPKIVDPSLLVGKLVNFDKRTKLKIDGTKFIIHPTEPVNSINLLSKNLKIIHPISTLKMQDYKKHKEKNEVTKSEAFVPDFDLSVPVRHPIFGSGYKKKIVLSEEIERKLDRAIEKEVRRMKKKKHKDEERQEFLRNSEGSEKKKKSKKNVDVIDPESIFTPTTNIDIGSNPVQMDLEESISALLGAHVLKKKKKSLKNIKQEPESFTEKESEEEFAQNKNKSHSEQANFHSTEENFSFKEKKRKRKHSEMERSLYGESEYEDSFKRKRKKSMQVEAEPSTETGSFSEKKKHRKSVSEAKVSQEWAESTFNIKQEVENKSEHKKRHSSVKKEIIEPTAGETVEDSKHDNRKQKNSTKELSIVKTEDKRNSVGNKVGKLDKRNSIINSTAIPGLQLPLFEFDVSGIMNKEDAGTGNDSSRNEDEIEGKVRIKQEHEKKKKKEKSFETDDESVKKKLKRRASEPREIKKEQIEELNSPKKKRKKEETQEESDEETNSLISNLLNRVKSELGSSVANKKKKKEEK